MHSEPSPGASGIERTIVSQRVMPFARGTVFRSFAEPDMLRQWWGPNGFRNTFHLFDFRPGGEWRFTMHAPGGGEFENFCRFVEIVPPERLVFDHLEPVHNFRVTAAFESRGDYTHIRFSMAFTDNAEYLRVRDIIQEKNEENFDRLEAVLRTNNKSQEEIK